MDSQAVESPKKDYTELVYWVWQYFGGCVLGPLGLLWQMGYRP